VRHLGRARSARSHLARCFGSQFHALQSGSLESPPRPARQVEAALATAVAHTYCFPLPQATVAPPVPSEQPMQMTFASRELGVALIGTLAGCSGTRGQASVGYISEMAFKKLACNIRYSKSSQAYADVLP